MIMSKQSRISACLVVYNEASVLEKCLKSLQGLADEIVLVHDGECGDETLEIASKYTDKIFVRPHVGMMEAHLVFAFEQARFEWLLRIDADEFFDEQDIDKIKNIVSDEKVDGVKFLWEMWNGKEPVRFAGLEKMALFRKNSYHYCGIPHEGGKVDGTAYKTDIILHHRPTYNNISWRSFLRKRKKWVPIHALYFFSEQVKFNCYNSSPESWIDYCNKVRSHPILYIALMPLKNFLGQMKNGLWRSRLGTSIALQQYVYYFSLYWQVWQMDKKLKSH